MIFGKELAEKTACKDDKNLEKSTIFWNPYRPQRVNWLPKTEKKVSKTSENVRVSIIPC